MSPLNPFESVVGAFPKYLPGDFSGDARFDPEARRDLLHLLEASVWMMLLQTWKMTEAALKNKHWQKSLIMGIDDMPRDARRQLLKSSQITDGQRSAAIKVLRTQLKALRQVKLDSLGAEGNPIWVIDAAREPMCNCAALNLIAKSTFMPALERLTLARPVFEFLINPSRDTWQKIQPNADKPDYSEIYTLLAETFMVQAVAFKELANNMARIDSDREDLWQESAETHETLEQQRRLVKDSAHLKTQVAELQAANRALTDKLTRASAATEQQRQIAAALERTLGEVRNSKQVLVPDTASASRVLSLESDVRRLQEGLAAQAGELAASRQHESVLLSTISDLQTRVAESKVLSHFKRGIEAAPAAASTDHLLQYCSQESVAATLPKFEAFLERFLTATTKGASSSTNVNSFDGNGVASGSYSNMVLRPLINFVKHESQGDPALLSALSVRTDWAALVARYSAGFTGANRKERMVLYVGQLLRAQSLQLPFFASLQHLADIFDQVDAGNADLSVLANNMREALAGDNIRRELAELVTTLSSRA